jgi:predicted HicB family RNase H-like nuclease
VQLNVRIPEDLHRRIRMESARRKTPIREIVMEVLEKRF